MKTFTDRLYQFEQVFDGAYRYLDRCGEFMESVRRELDFMHLSVSPAGCDMESSDASIRLQASTERLVMTSNDPSQEKKLIEAADFACSEAARLFQPFSVEYNRLTLSSVIAAKSLEESFKISIIFLPDLTEKLSKCLDLPSFNQDCNFAFESGTHRVHIHLYPASLNVTAAERRLPVLGYPKAHGQHLLRKERILEQTNMRPSYALNLEISVVESAPMVETSVRSLVEAVLTYKRRILKFFKQ